MSRTHLRLSAIASLMFLAAAAPSPTQDAPVPVAPPATSPAATPCCDDDAGKPDPDAPLPMDRKSVLLQKLAEKTRNSKAPFFGEEPLRELDHQIAALDEGTSAAERGRLLARRGDERLQFGMVDEAIADFQEALALAHSSSNPKQARAVKKQLAIAWLRLGERRNCIANHNQDSCVLPIKEGGLHRDPTGSDNAMMIYRELLQQTPGDESSMWLLHIAAMTLGRYPDGVPARWRLPASAFESEREMPRMFDAAPKYGLDVHSNAGGAILDDFDRDGRLDLLVSSMDPTHPLRLYHQTADRTFRNVAAEVGLSGQIGGLQIRHFDANNDGRLDILVLRGGWMFRAGEIPNSLLIQQEDGTFVDLTREAGIEVAAPTQAACVADADNDGDLDLFIGYEDASASQGGHYPSRLYRNRGDGTFEDLSRQAGVENCGFVKGCAFADYDGDRLPDLYVSNMRGDNLLFHNEGDFRFVDVARKLGVHAPEDSFSSFFFDYDNDGWLDLYASCYETSDRVGNYAAYLRDGVASCDVNRLYRNDGRGGFTDVTSAVRLDRVAYPMGSSFGDIDNDGFQDIYLATGAPEFQSLFPNVLYRNDGGRRFQDVTATTGTGMLQKGHGVAFGDLDGDGDQDFYAQTGGAYRDDRFRSILYENPGHGNRWITVRLEGTRSNRFGVGARIKATIEEEVDGATATRTICHFVGMNSSFGGNSLQAEMGLGQAAKITSLEVWWPTSDLTQTFTDVPLDKVLAIEEDRPRLRVIDPDAAW